MGVSAASEAAKVVSMANSAGEVESEDRTVLRRVGRQRSYVFLRWLGVRVAFSLAVLLVLSLLIFIATTILPGNIADIVLGQNATPAAVQALSHRLHLDTPAPERYLLWLGNIIQLNFGTSLQSGQPVWPIVSTAFFHSLILAAAAGVAMIVTAVLVGLWAGLRTGSVRDKVILALSFIGLSMPEFVVGSILIWLFVVLVPIFPALSLVGGGTPLLEWVKMLVLPTLTVIPVTGSYIVRTMRAATKEVMQEEFVNMAVLRGLPDSRIVWRHVFPNSLVPMVNVLSVNMGWLVGGIVVVEVLYQYPGIGYLLIQAIGQRDIPIVQAAALLIGSVYVALNLLADVTIAVLDPRVGRALN